MYSSYEESLKATLRKQEHEFSKLNLERVKLIDNLDRLNKKIEKQADSLAYTLHQIGTVEEEDEWTSSL